MFFKYEKKRKIHILEHCLQLKKIDARELCGMTNCRVTTTAAT